MKTKYPIKVAGQLYRKGTLLRQATPTEMRQIWPGIAPSQDSPQIGVWFPGRPLPTIVEKSQVE